VGQWTSESSFSLFVSFTVTFCFQSLQYRFLTGAEHQKYKVRKVIPEWEKYCSIKFVEAQDTDNVDIRITSDPSEGSWSYVGTDVLNITNPNEATMNLGSIGQGTDDLSPIEVGTILHEFGHSLGLTHEHRSPSRGGRVTLKNDGESLT